MLDSLQRRRRGRPLVALKRALTGAAVAHEAALRRERDDALRRLAELEPLEAVPLHRSVRGPGPGPGPVSYALARELGDWEPDLSREDAHVNRVWEAADERGKLLLRLRLAVWQDAPGFCERTGLSRADPPEDVHAMARGVLAAAGGLDGADLVAGALELAGADVAHVGAALDFGGSSGRVVRVLQAGFPEVQWHSCDPNERAIEWATEHLPAVRFHVSPQEPPLPFEAGHFGLVYAISVWSHLSGPAALRWFAEMERILAPGGLLVATVQSWQTTYHLAANRLWELRDVREAIADMYTDGHHFRRTFGPGGDFGVESPDWGFATMSAEWLVRHLTPAWELLLWRSGALSENQDVIVLRRRA
jgi:SAM-dependent methyltransferase